LLCFYFPKPEGSEPLPLAQRQCIITPADHASY
jgi:hypothetical protein